MIQSVLNEGVTGIQPGGINGSSKVKSGGSDFGQMLKSAIEKVNDAQTESDMKTEAFASGKIENLHDVMIASQKASIMMETAVQMQKKAIDAYNEIMRMQV
ncbi:flagellar hook-basal body complex protein FliE [Aciduricibacillus chroicocephali]|uniref:flagellar hook-basal body complex protein FliE n=1 Tax=Aciduricibacillus chroicocephali TaxID=3054939 RepID=UPI003D658732